MGSRRGKPVVLVVDDEPDLVDLYAADLAGDNEVLTAYGGEEALELIESGRRLDVALIDRRMPDVSGDELLELIHDASPECRVAMVTAVEPDFDVIEMPFDEYLVKPIAEADVRNTVGRLLDLESYREKRQEGFALASKAAALRAHKDPEELAGNEEYEQLVERLAGIRADLDDAAASFEPGDFAAAFADIDVDEAPVTTTD